MTADVICRRCGHRHDDTPTFCASCGAFLEWTGHNEALDPEPEPSPIAVASAERLQQAGALAASADRSDLSHRLSDAAQRVERPAVPVVAVGQFKVGKSRLVNSIVNTNLCPSDHLIGSVVPVTVEYGHTAEARILTHAGETRMVPHEELDSWVTEEGNAANHRGVASARVDVARSFLGSGLQIVDTPGLGGLDSPAGRLLASSAESAAGVMLVTSAVQEMTQPELEFLERVRSSNPALAVVVTKTDLVVHWKRIVEINTGHLERAGFDVPVFPVSATLRSLAAEGRDRSLNEESGYPPLLAWLADVARSRADHEARRADRQLRDATAQLRSSAKLAEQVLDQPERAEPVIEHLLAVASASRDLTNETADWRALLQQEIDGLNDWSSVELSQRLEGVQENSRALLAETDVSGSWPEVEAWVRRAVSDQAVELIDAMAERFAQIAESVGTVAGCDRPLADAADFPTVGSVGGRLMVGEVGQRLVLPIDQPAELVDPSTTPDERLAAALTALEAYLAATGERLRQLLDSEAESLLDVIGAEVETQGEDVARSAEATASMARSAADPEVATTALSLSDLRRQLDGLDAIDAALTEAGTQG